MRIVAGVLSVWIALRWIGFLLGIVRIRGFEGPARREARRTVVARGAWNVFLSVGVVYLWAAIDDVQPSEQFVGFLAATMMCSLVIGVASFFMQPEERTVATLDICRIRRTRPREISAEPTGVPPT